MSEENSFKVVEYIIQTDGNQNTKSLVSSDNIHSRDLPIKLSEYNTENTHGNNNRRKKLSIMDIKAKASALNFNIGSLGRNNTIERTSTAPTRNVNKINLEGIALNQESSRQNRSQSIGNLENFNFLNTTRETSKKAEAIYRNSLGIVPLQSLPGRKSHEETQLGSLSDRGNTAYRDSIDQSKQVGKFSDLNSKAFLKINEEFDEEISFTSDTSKNKKMNISEIPDCNQFADSFKEKQEYLKLGLESSNTNAKPAKGKEVHWDLNRNYLQEQRNTIDNTDITTKPSIETFGKTFKKTSKDNSNMPRNVSMDFNSYANRGISNISTGVKKSSFNIVSDPKRTTVKKSVIYTQNHDRPKFSLLNNQTVGKQSSNSSLNTANSKPTKVINSLNANGVRHKKTSSLNYTTYKNRSYNFNSGEEKKPIVYPSKVRFLI